MATKSTPYDGYIAVDKKNRVKMHGGSTADRARGAKASFDSDIEGMRTSYETYKRKDDPSSKEVSRRMGKASEDAIGRVQASHKAAADEMQRESRRGQPEKKAAGGVVGGRRGYGLARGGRK